MPEKPCPNCGHCPTCGHRPTPAPVYPYPYWPYGAWPYWYPYYQTSPTIVWSSTSTGALSGPTVTSGTVGVG